MLRPRLTAAVICVAALASTPAVAHPRLLKSMPAADAVVTAPTRVELRFSERLLPQLSGAAIVMVGMPGMADHAPMPVAGTASAVGPGGEALIVTSRKPLPAGTYRIDWHVVSADTHRVTGSYVFSVR